MVSAWLSMLGPSNDWKKSSWELIQLFSTPRVLVLFHAVPTEACWSWLMSQVRSLEGKLQCGLLFKWHLGGQALRMAYVKRSIRNEKKHQGRATEKTVLCQLPLL